MTYSKNLSPISRRQSQKSSEQIKKDSKQNQVVRKLLELSKKYGEKKQGQ